MRNINPYLNFAGNAEEAFEFYRSVFGGEFKMLQRFKDTPDGDKMSPEDREKIMHISLPIGQGNTLMATDATEPMGFKLVQGNNFYLSLDADSKEEAQTLFQGLSAGGHIEMPLDDTFWGSYFGMFKDRFGINWMISYDYPSR